MCRTQQANDARLLAYDEYISKCDHDITIADRWAFNAGFIAGLDYAGEKAIHQQEKYLTLEISKNADYELAGEIIQKQQRKLDAYAAYVAGKITLKELEEVINQ